MLIPLTLSIGLKKDGRIYRVERIDHRGTSIYCISGIPNGHHLSVHDANADHPLGVIQERLSQGTFRISPGDVPLGKKVIIAQIPPFAAITDPVPLGSDNISVQRIDKRTLNFAKELRAGMQTESVVFDADAVGDRFVGWFLLLLQAGDWAGVERWYRLRYADVPDYRLESVHTWSRVRPWLGLGFVSAPFPEGADP